MKKLPLTIIALLVIGCILVATTAETKDAEEPQAVDLPRGDTTTVRHQESLTADKNECDLTDTMMIIGDKVLGKGFLASDEILRLWVVYDMKPLTFDPTLKYSALSPGRLIIDMIGRKGGFDAGNPTCLADIKAFLGPLRGYQRYQKDYYQMGYVEHADTTIPLFRYNFVLDYPDSTQVNDDILPWLASLVQRAEGMSEPQASSAAQYMPSDSVKYAVKGFTGQSIGDMNAKKFFETMPDNFAEYCPWGYHMTVDLRARVSNDRYVTYRSFVHSHEATTHGMYTEYLHTYDRKNKREVDYDYLFKPGTSAEVQRLLYEVMAEDTIFTKSKNMEPTADAVKQWVVGYSMDESDGSQEKSLSLSKPGLTDEGIVFSFQPYEIDCFAAGAYHFTVPYAKARPYMTHRGLDLAGL